jgi:hypothetical protein
LGIAKAFGTTGTEESGWRSKITDHLQEIKRARADRLHALNWLLEREAYTGLASEVIHLIGLCGRHHLEHRAKIIGSERAEFDGLGNAKPLESLKVAAMAITAGTYNPIAQIKQVPGQIGTILAGDTSDQGRALGTWRNHTRTTGATILRFRIARRVRTND